MLPVIRLAGFVDVALDTVDHDSSGSLIDVGSGFDLVPGPCGGLPRPGRGAVIEAPLHGVEAAVHADPGRADHRCCAGEVRVDGGLVDWCRVEVSREVDRPVGGDT